MKRSFKLMASLCVAVMAVLRASAQDGTTTVSGTVVDNVGTPIVGASVFVDGTNIGTITDSEGRYSISVPDGAQITVQYVGYDSVVVSADGGTADVTLYEESSDFEELLVAMGYGIQKKSDISTSISTIQAKDLNRGVLLSSAELVQGRVPGLVVTSDANPNNTNVRTTLRGASTLRSGVAAEPYYVVDGVPGMSLDLVSPSDIVSIDVLKDAAATAIYGSKGSNGVIIITTKHGNTTDECGGEVEVSYDGFAQVATVAKKYDMMSASEYKSWLAESGETLLTSLNKDGDTDWQDEATRTAFAHGHNVAISGGASKARYAASISYVNATGVMRGTDMQHLLGRAYLQAHTLNDHLTVGITANASQKKRNDILAGEEGESVYYAMAYFIPTLPVQNADGSYTNNTVTKSYNPVALNKMRTDFTKSRHFLIGGQATVDIIDGLTYDVSVSYQNEQNNYNYYYTSEYPLLLSANGSASRASVENSKLVFETYAKYAKTFADKHNVDLLVGYSWEENNDNDGIQVTGSNFFDDALSYYNLGMSNSTARNDYGGYQLSTLRMISLYGRLNYNFDSRYLLQVTVRRDGSSAFGTNNRWATFPSFAAAWRISDEAFAEGWDAVNDLKLRLGYGVSGNSLGFNVFSSRQLYGATGWTTDASGNSIQSLGPTSNANPDLKWERTKMMNVGLDMAFLSNRLKATVEFYNKDTEDLIADYPVSTTKYLYGWMTANVGEINNRGVELTIDAKPVERGDFKWETSVNLSHNKNKVEKISNDEYSVDFMDRAVINATGQNGYNTQRIIEGEPIGTFYTYEWAGYNADGVSQFYEYDPASGQRVKAADGSDAVTTSPSDKDRVKTGCAQPKLTFGWDNAFSWRKWTLGVFFSGVAGNDILDVTCANLSSVVDAKAGRYNLLSDADIRNTDINSHIVSDRYVQNGSYFRLNSLSLAYSFGSIGWVSDLNVSIVGKNIFTATGYDGYNPEVSLSGDAPGLDRNTHPQTRSLMLGLNIKL